MHENLQIATALGVAAMLVLLRLQAERFGAAEYDEPSNRYGRPWTRLAWYGLGFAFLLLVFTIHPRPQGDLLLVVGGRVEVLAAGLLLAALGIVQAAAFARYRYGELRFPPASPAAYAGAALNSVATAAIDEATFRGIVLGVLLVAGLPAPVAILGQAALYVLATRLATPGRSFYMPVLAASMGLAFGAATYLTDGIGAAILAHSATTFALFLCTGHAGQVPPFGEEPEEVLARHRPEGWVEVPAKMKSARPAAAPVAASAPGPAHPAPRSGAR